jgi:hypothetical protein
MALASGIRSSAAGGAGEAHLQRASKSNLAL